MDTLIDKTTRQQNLADSQRPNVEKWFNGTSFSSPKPDSIEVSEPQKKNIASMNQINKNQDSHNAQIRRKRYSTPTRHFPHSSSTKGTNYSSRRAINRRAARYFLKTFLNIK